MNGMLQRMNPSTLMPDTCLTRSNDTGALWLYMRCGLAAIANTELQKWWDQPEATLKLHVLDTLEVRRQCVARRRSGRFRSVTRRSPVAKERSWCWSSAAG